MLKTISIQTDSRNQMVDITHYIQDAINESKVTDGICIVYTPHTTTAITINEGADPGVKNDILNFLKDKIPVDYEFEHIEGNSDSHLKSSGIGVSENIIINEGRLMLGRRQKVYFCDFDGPRTRKFFIKTI